MPLAPGFHAREIRHGFVLPCRTHLPIDRPYAHRKQAIQGLTALADRLAFLEDVIAHAQLPIRLMSGARAVMRNVADAMPKGGYTLIVTGFKL